MDNNTNNSNPNFPNNPPIPPAPTPTPPDATVSTAPPPPDLPPPPQPEPNWPPVQTTVGPGPIPTFDPQPEQVPPAPTPLDNPWGAPTQPPPIDSPTQTAEPPPAESPPTDLSHLIGNDSLTNTPPQEPSSSTPQLETLVAPPPANSVPEVPTLPAEGNKGIPKWVIGLGVGLLIIVAGASAYFILGIGQPPKTKSIPATQTPTTQQIKAPPPVAQPTPAATGSASFGELEGSKQATSAGDLLRQGR